MSFFKPFLFWVGITIAFYYGKFSIYLDSELTTINRIILLVVMWIIIYGLIYTGDKIE